MSWEDALAELQSRFDVAETIVPCGGRTLTIVHPRSADPLISEEDFVKDERLPYWADLWPSARVLADHVIRHRGDGRRALELGCGSGLVATALAIAGYRVTATDYYTDALDFTRVNVERNAGRRAVTRHVDWRDYPRDLGGFDVVVASDVLYEHTYGELVADALVASLAPAGYALIADPGRVSLQAFLDAIEERGLVTAERWDVPYAEGAQRHTIQVHALRIR